MKKKIIYFNGKKLHNYIFNHKINNQGKYVLPSSIYFIKVTIEGHLSSGMYQYNGFPSPLLDAIEGPLWV